VVDRLLIYHVANEQVHKHVLSAGEAIHCFPQTKLRLRMLQGQIQIRILGANPIRLKYTQHPKSVRLKCRMPGTSIRKVSASIEHPDLNRSRSIRRLSRPRRRCVPVKSEVRVCSREEPYGSEGTDGMKHASHQPK